LTESAFNKLCCQQGLAFANFVVHSESRKAIEKDLPGTISTVVDDSAVVQKNKSMVKDALLRTIRDIIYRGTEEQIEFVRRLSHTYITLFLLQCDPKLAAYFRSMAARLRIYVGTSIIIPALSEYFLQPQNRRHWNLLIGASRKGVRLVVNNTILNELVAHFRRILGRYKDLFENEENTYLDDEIQTLYVDEIIIRAYFYAKREKKISSFNAFIDLFVSPDLRTAREELTTFLNDTFGITFVDDKSLQIELCQQDVNAVAEALRQHKGFQAKAENDAQLVLTVFGLREKNNEQGDSGVIGYRTWWLSKDTMTQRAVNKVLGDRYPVGCYIRPDFLYNYISFAPDPEIVDDLYDNVFPSLVGINMSATLPLEITKVVQRKIADHAALAPNRKKAVLRRLAEDLKENPKLGQKKELRHYLDERLGDISKS